VAEVAAPIACCSSTATTDEATSPDRTQIGSWKGVAECPGEVAAPEIAFPSRRCNKTGHNQR
jgi:hypothetical protein